MIKDVWKNIEIPYIKMDKIEFFLYTLIIIFVMLFAYNRFSSNKCEGMRMSDKHFTNKYKTNNTTKDIYTEYYASIYDQLFLDKARFSMELDQAAYYSKMTKKSNVLDIGSGTGHHLRILHEVVGDCRGIESSKEMIKQTKRNYPYIQVDLGDAMDTMTYSAGTFTHITMFYFTIYYFKDKYGILSNVYKWLRPGGYFIVHLVNRRMFDPVVGLSNPLTFANPQKYAKKRITKSTIHFNDIEFTSDFKLDDKSDTAIFEEKMKHKDTNHIIQNNHTLYMPSLKSIVEQAERLGMTVVKVIDLNKVQNEYNYIYILKKG